MSRKWEMTLTEKYPFMQQNHNDSENNIYRRWGCECASGWLQLLMECCEAIVSRYAEDGIGLIDIDFEPVQIKEKFGKLRFYYGYTDAPCGIAAFDNLVTGTSMRFEPQKSDIDDAKAKLRQDIRVIINAAEEKSQYICEICGAEGELRNDSGVGIHWVRTLCDSCHEKRIRKAIETREKKDNNRG